ncbi:putative dNMP kinase [Caulobacter phage CcrRogue]|uniref:Putative dNMP kinase n=1 Tax=Caulobacter phage CcrRogue TaxID=2927986 RepID=K4JNM1_9CAUD|nr:putative dNMP kinase [Caulobacter phage CcrRogue]AFU86596.1 putative dNMP kinase [Caulobacter phage CcrRogue]
MNIVAITGPRGHGKSTAAAALEARGYVHINFADPLREIAKIAYGVTMEEMLDPVLKETKLERWPFKSPREILQHIGTDMFRHYVDDTWVQAWGNKARAYLDGKVTNGFGGVREVAGVVCSDCRFLNEAEMVRRLKGVIIRVQDPRKRATDAASQHASETEMAKIVPDWTITNDREIADLHAAIEMIVFDKD